MGRGALAVLHEQASQTEASWLVVEEGNPWGQSI